MNGKERIKHNKLYLVLVIAFVFFGATVFIRIAVENVENSSENNGDGFPDFITKTSDYFVARIESIPQINPITYRVRN